MSIHESGRGSGGSLGSMRGGSRGGTSLATASTRTGAGGGLLYLLAHKTANSTEQPSRGSGGLLERATYTPVCMRAGAGGQPGRDSGGPPQ